MEKTKQALRFLKPPPPGLQILIQMANKIPPDLELPDLDQALMSEANALRVDGDHAGFIGKKMEALEVTLERLPAELRDFFWNSTDFTIMLSPRWDPADDYCFFRTLGKNLRDIAAMGRFRFGSVFPLRMDTITLLSSVSGKIQVQVDPLVELLEGVETARIRECMRCRRIYWAGRLDMRACSSSCANALRQQLWRAHYRSRYKLRRAGYKVESKTRDKKKKLSKSKRG